MNIGMWIVCILGGSLGILSSLYCILSIPIVIGTKIYRRVRYGISIFN